MTPQDKHTFHPRVINNTNIPFSNSEMTLLQKGLKYNLHTNKKNMYLFQDSFNLLLILDVLLWCVQLWRNRIVCVCSALTVLFVCVVR